ncbi:MAG TPA: ArdC family protein [Mycobacteriales bacterium]|nr:ArdC family protein [Mycobacteriales bacterium]
MTRRETGADRLAAIHAQLLDQVERLTSSEAWKTTLQVAARFHSYSPNNVLLIAAQRPDATRVAGYRAWAQLGRQVRKGEHGIAILAPVLRRADQEAPACTDGSQPRASAEAVTTRRVLSGFRVTHVFDVAQTDGPDLPDLRPTLLDGASPLGLWSDLFDQVEVAGYGIDYADLGEANGRTDFTDHTVILHTGRSGAQLTKTLAHELGHITMHAPDVRPEGMTRDTAEIEAESVAYVVTAAHGLFADDYSVPYVTGWSNGDVERIAASATRVLATARTILRAAPPPRATAPGLIDGIDRHLAHTISRPVEPAGMDRAVGR